MVSPLSNPSTPKRRSNCGRGNPLPSKILDFLYLGSVDDAQDARFLSRNNIRYIINVSAEEYWSVDKDIVVYPFRVEDTCNADISVFFKPTINIIERVRRLYYAATEHQEALTPRILVHCQRGRSRSPTIVIAYLLVRHGWPLSEALQYVCKRRPSVEPNIGFIAALRKLQNSVSSIDRAKLFSQQSVIVKNISRSTTAAALQEFFERRIGLVRDVVVHARPLASSKAGEAPTETGAPATTSAPPSGAAPEESCPSEEASICLVFFASFENVKLARAYAATHETEMSLLGPVPNRSIRLVVPSSKVKVHSSRADPPESLTARSQLTGSAQQHECHEVSKGADSKNEPS